MELGENGRKVEIPEITLGMIWVKIVTFYSPDFREPIGRPRPQNYRHLQDRFNKFRSDPEFRRYLCLAYQERLWVHDSEVQEPAQILKEHLFSKELPEDFDFGLVRDTLAYLLPSQE